MKVSSFTAALAEGNVCNKQSENPDFCKRDSSTGNSATLRLQAIVCF